MFQFGVPYIIQRRENLPQITYTVYISAMKGILWTWRYFFWILCSTIYPCAKVHVSRSAPVWVHVFPERKGKLVLVQLEARALVAEIWWTVASVVFMLWNQSLSPSPGPTWSASRGAERHEGRMTRWEEWQGWKWWLEWKEEDRHEDRSDRSCTARVVRRMIFGEWYECGLYCDQQWVLLFLRMAAAREGLHSQPTINSKSGEWTCPRLWPR